MRNRFSLVDHESDHYTNWRVTNVAGLVNQASGIMDDITCRRAPRFAAFGAEFQGALKHKRVLVPWMCVTTGCAPWSKFGGHHDRLLRIVTTQSCSEKHLRGDAGRLSIRVRRGKTRENDAQCDRGN